MPRKPEDQSELVVKVTPRSSRNRLEITGPTTMSLWTTAQPTDGQANVAACEMVAKAAGVPKSSVGVISGHSSRNKRIRVEGLSQTELMRRLGISP